MAFQQRTGSILAADIGNVTTRAVLLDRVEGLYRFVARGEAPTTAGLPWNDITEGLRAAIGSISATTARELLEGGTDDLLTPEGSDRSGVDSFVATASAGKPMRAILVGLVPDVSLESGRRAAEDSYLEIEDIFSLADNRSREEQVDALLAIDPDLIVIVGGTDGGATSAMAEQVRTVALACHLIESGNKPRVLFAGNVTLHDEVKHLLEEQSDMDIVYADNVRPSLDVERLDDAKARLGDLLEGYRISNTDGFYELRQWSRTGVVPTARAFGRIIHLMGEHAQQPVMGVDIGSKASTVAAWQAGGLVLKVCNGLGQGHGAKGVLDYAAGEDLARWLTAEYEDESEAGRQAVNYAWNKWLTPATLPQTPEELELELALAREVLRAALNQARASWPRSAEDGLLPHFSQIVAGGSVLAHTPHPADSALVILDALQPVGVTQLWLDAYGVAAALGAAAPLDALAAVQVIETGGFLNLGTAVCPMGRARHGQVVLQAELTPSGEEEAQSFEVQFGSIVCLPLLPGLRAQLSLRPRGVEVGLTRRERTFEVVGGALGVIIDARGRPLRLPPDAQARREALREWRAALWESEAS